MPDDLLQMKPGQLLARGVCRHLASHDFVTVEEFVRGPDTVDGPAPPPWQATGRPPGQM